MYTPLIVIVIDSTVDKHTVQALAVLNVHCLNNVIARPVMIVGLKC